MSTIMPDSELFRRAVSYIDEMLREQPGTRLSKLVDEAAMRFNLSPLDSESLLRIFSSGDSRGLDTTR